MVNWLSNKFSFSAKMVCMRVKHAFEFVKDNMSLPYMGRDVVKKAHSNLHKEIRNVDNDKNRRNRAAERCCLRIQHNPLWRI